MPTYEYRCQKCGHRFERTQGIKDAPLKRCPQCGSEVQRVITGGGGFLFKGESARAQSSSSCCGTTNPCSDPKRCCHR